MAYILTGFLVFLVFIGYLIHLSLVKKDMKRFKAVFVPGIFFVVVWIALYYLVFKS